MLARGDGGGRATVRNARIPRRFRAVSYEHATSLELARCTRDSAAACTRYNICFARIQRCDHTSTNTPDPIRTPQLDVSSTRMGDLLESPRVAPLFRCFFFLNSTDLSRSICYGRRMRLDRDGERASKSGLPAMFT